MRIFQRGLAITASAGALLAAPACSAIDFLSDNCDDESIIVTWPASITRGAATTQVTLNGAVGEDNIDPAQFNILKQLLVTGGIELTTNVIWTVNAFDVNGGYIAFQHRAPLSTGETLPVNFAFDGGGWGVVPSSRPLDPIVAVRADNFNATSATGTINAVVGQPLRLRIDVTTKNAMNETMRLTGNAAFQYRKVSASCS